MHRAFAFLIFALLATFSLAAPLPASKAPAKHHFRVPVRGRTKLSAKEELARVYRKYGWEIVTFGPSKTSDDTTQAQPDAPASKSGHRNGTKSSTSSGNGQGEVHASAEQNDSEYLSPVSIGGQTLTLDLDTGSADLWVFSSKLPADEVSGHTLYDPSKSQTWSEYQGASWKTSYGDGSGAWGVVGFDTVNIGGAVVTKQCVEIAEHVSGQFEQDTQSDGIVGLGFSSINQVRPQPQKTFFENIMDDLDQPVFTADLQDGSGTYEFGNIDSSSYTGDIHYTSIDKSQGYWQFETPTYSVGGTQQQCASVACGATIADTGTSLMLMDLQVVNAYYRQVHGASFDDTFGGYKFPCSSPLPDFGIEIGNSGYTATVQGSDLIYLQIDTTHCLGGLQWNGGINLSILGDVLLKHHFAVFDGGNLRFGIAEQT